MFLVMLILYVIREKVPYPFLQKTSMAKSFLDQKFIQRSRLDLNVKHHLMEKLLPQGLEKIC